MRKKHLVIVMIVVNVLNMFVNVRLDDMFDNVLVFVHRGRDMNMNGHRHRNRLMDRHLARHLNDSLMNHFKRAVNWLVNVVNHLALAGHFMNDFVPLRNKT